METLDPIEIERVARGDEEAFRRLFDRSYVELVRHAAFYTLDIAVAEDIVQDVLAHLWGNRKSLGGVGNLEGYMLNGIRNRCLNHIKHSKVRNKYRQDHMLHEVSAVETDPETYYKAIDALIEKMPEKRRQVFALSVYESKSYAQIAEIANISVNTVKDHIKAAYAYLRKESAFIPYP